jgi:hypothetical protein
VPYLITSQIIIFGDIVFLFLFLQVGVYGCIVLAIYVLLYIVITFCAQIAFDIMRKRSPPLKIIGAVPVGANKGGLGEGARIRVQAAGGGEDRIDEAKPEDESVVHNLPDPRRGLRGAVQYLALRTRPPQDSRLFEQLLPGAVRGHLLLPLPVLLYGMFTIVKA